jgi:transcriptional regulator with XRE-family HTH domain
MKKREKKANLRNLLGLSQAEYAEFLGVSRSAVSMNESTGKIYPLEALNAELKLMNLVYISSDKNKSPDQEKKKEASNSKKLDSLEIKKLQNHIAQRVNLAENKIAKLKKEIETYETNFSDDATLLAQLKSLKFKDLNGLSEEHDLYRELMIKRISSRLKKFSAYELMLREYEISRLQAECEQGERFLKNLFQ